MQQSVKSVIFADVNNVVTAAEEKQFEMSDDSIFIQTSYSCISAGTELAKLTGLQTIKYPICLGNRAIGRVLQTGSNVRHVKPGDLVFTHTAHKSHTMGSGLVAKLPESLDAPESATIGMGMVALVGVQTAAAELGDTAVVTGGGLVGQFAAQLLQLAGVRVILVDPLAGRLKLAQQCGIEHTVLAGMSAKEEVMAITNGKGADAILECTGVPAVAEQAAEFAVTSGTMVLVGSPRGAHNADFSAFLNQFHLWRNHGNLTLKGAHEWKIPVYESAFIKHSMQRNLHILASLSVEGKLKIKPLVSRVYHPDQAAFAYDDLLRNKDNVLGAVFDWTKAEAL